jgi:hypothetical protein
MRNKSRISVIMLSVAVAMVWGTAASAASAKRCICWGESTFTRHSITAHCHAWAPKGKGAQKYTGNKKCTGRWDDDKYKWQPCDWRTGKGRGELCDHSKYD